MKRIKSFLKKHRTSVLVIVLAVLMAFLVMVMDKKNSVIEGNRIIREEKGGKSTSYDFLYETDTGQEGGLKLDVAAQEYDPKEIEEIMNRAVELWDESFLGNNVSAGEVREDLNLLQSYNGVNVTYMTSDYELLDESGHVKLDNLSVAGEDSENSEDEYLVELTAVFNIGDYSREEIRSLRIVEPDPDSNQWFQYVLGKKVKKTEQDTAGQPDFILPDRVEGHLVKWKYNTGSKWYVFLFLGGVAVFALEYKVIEDKKNRRKKYEAQLLNEYPLLVEQLALLCGSGMTIRYAWERIILMNENTASQEEGSRLYIQEMKKTMEEMKKGMGEAASYERFGNRTGILVYKRLGSMLSQNLTKGSQNMIELLEYEQRAALDIRKNNVIRLGEEASTKLVFPMLCMFVLLIIVIILPAIRQM